MKQAIAHTGTYDASNDDCAGHMRRCEDAFRLCDEIVERYASGRATTAPQGYVDPTDDHRGHHEAAHILIAEKNGFTVVFATIEYHRHPSGGKAGGVTVLSEDARRGSLLVATEPLSDSDRDFLIQSLEYVMAGCIAEELWPEGPDPVMDAGDQYEVCRILQRLTDDENAMAMLCDRAQQQVREWLSASAIAWKGFRDALVDALAEPKGNRDLTQQRVRDLLDRYLSK